MLPSPHPGAPKLRETRDRAPPSLHILAGSLSPPGSPEGAGSTVLVPGHASRMDSDQEGCGFRQRQGRGPGPRLRGGLPGPLQKAQRQTLRPGLSPPPRLPRPCAARCGGDPSRVPSAHVCTHSHAHARVVPWYFRDWFQDPAPTDSRNLGAPKLQGCSVLYRKWCIIGM